PDLTKAVLPPPVQEGGSFRSLSRESGSFRSLTRESGSFRSLSLSKGRKDPLFRALLLAALVEDAVEDAADDEPAHDAAHDVAATATASAAPAVAPALLLRTRGVDVALRELQRLRGELRDATRGEQRLLARLFGRDHRRDVDAQPLGLGETG